MYLTCARVEADETDVFARSRAACRPVAAVLETEKETETKTKFEMRTKADDITDAYPI